MGIRFLMKINIWLNDYYNRYNLSPKNQYNHIDVELFHKIIDETNKEDLIILRGEPTIHPFLWQLLNKLEDRNYILSTESTNINPLINYKKNIPYISFRFDGYQNDQIKGQRSLSLNMNKIISEFSGKQTILRIEYTISPYNMEYLDADMMLIRKIVNQHSKMKNPYFVIYQQSEIYNHQGYIWTPLSKEKINQLNKFGLLSQRSMKFFDAWLNKRDYSCLSPRNQLVIDYNGDVRLCQSMRFYDIIGSVKEENLQDIVNNTKSTRDKASECPMRQQCWLAYHYKDNVNA